MRPTLTQAQHVLDAVKPAFLPILTFTCCLVPSYAPPARNQLLLSAIAWLAVFVACATRVGLRDTVSQLGEEKHVLLAGCMYAFALGCERAANDRGGLLGPQALLPAAIYAGLRLFLETQSTSRVHTRLEKANKSALGRLVMITTLSALIVLSGGYVRFSVLALGASAAVFRACALLLLEDAFHQALEEKEHIPNGSNELSTLSTRRLLGGLDAHIRKTRSLALAVCTWLFVLSVSFESFKRWEMTYRPQDGPIPSTEKQIPPVKTLYNNWNAGVDVLAVTSETAKAIAMLCMIQQHGSIEFSLLVVGASLIAQVSRHFSLQGVLPTLTYALAGLLIFDDVQPASWFSSSRRRMRTRQVTTLLAAVSLLFVLHSFVTRPQRLLLKPPPPSIAPFPAEPPLENSGPLKQTDVSSHPIDQLIRSAETQFSELLKSQSQTIDQAVVEYKRRYGIPPPPKFDIWFEFAKHRNVQLIDEYDTIHDQLQPFWGLEPKVIRSRVQEAMGFDNMLLSVLIRNGQSVKVSGGPEWQQEATVGMMKGFIEHLPDMDIVFNIHDEPRVIVAADTLAKLVNIAQTKNMPAALATRNPQNRFSARPTDLTNGKYVREYLTTRFNRFAHQHTWTHSRASCPADSPARDYEEESRDNVTSYAFGELGFVYNHTAFGNICNSPSFRGTFGFFDRPNAFNIVQDLFPIFSQSKISSFQDILYPSPWYWAGKVYFDKGRDPEWNKKENQLWWRGSTTGGFSRNGGWRRQHRQRVVRKINAPDRALILKNRAEENGGQPQWKPEEVNRRDFKDIMDIKFSHVGQCDPGDCEAQKQFFEIAEKADQQDAWKFKYLLDMDGNAFSGRFYAFLLSNSLVYKMSVFQEWHRDWLKPWVHYIPLSLKGDEWLEAVRYFAGEPEGKIQAPRMAFQGQEWAKKALRNDDFEVWFFRLLLEYARLVDDDREVIGYPGP